MWESNDCDGYVYLEPCQIVLGITDEGGPKGAQLFLGPYLFKRFMVLVISSSHRRCIAIVYFSFSIFSLVICDPNVIRDMVLCKQKAQV